MPKELIYKPLKNTFFKKSLLSGVGLFAKIGVLCSELLLKTFYQKPSIAMVDRYIEKFWRLNFRHTNTTLYATGRENLEPKNVYVFMSNHQSWMDFPSMFGTVPSSLRMVSKEGLMKVPLLGQAMYKSGFIAINRSNRIQAITQLEEAKRRLQEGISIWMAPEGTRSRDGKIKEFKKGGFHLALDLNLPIVPVFIEGAESVMPADGLTIHQNKSITVHFMSPIKTAGLLKSDIPELMAQVRQSIIKKSEEAKKHPKSVEPLCH